VTKPSNSNRVSTDSNHMFMYGHVVCCDNTYPFVEPMGSFARIGPNNSIGRFGIFLQMEGKSRFESERERLRRQFKLVRTKTRLSLTLSDLRPASERMREETVVYEQEESVSHGGGKHRILAELARVEQEVAFLEVAKLTRISFKFRRRSLVDSSIILFRSIVTTIR